MDLISDPDRFEDAIRALRDLAEEGQAYRSGGSLDHLLEGLIGAALSEFGSDKFDMPRRAGDLADADGIRHLLAAYGPAFLSVKEEAAASLVLKLFLARDFLKLGFGLPDETIREIEGTGRTLLSWRQAAQVHKHEKRRGKELAGSSKGGREKAEKRAPEIKAWHKKIQYRAKTMKGTYSKSEALDILEREFPGYSRRRLADIVSSVYPVKPRRAKSGE